MIALLCLTTKFARCGVIGKAESSSALFRFWYGLVLTARKRSLVNV
jgi:hypothetical protein